MQHHKEITEWHDEIAGKPAGFDPKGFSSSQLGPKVSYLAWRPKIAMGWIRVYCIIYKFQLAEKQRQNNDALPIGNKRKNVETTDSGRDVDS